MSINSSYSNNGHGTEETATSPSGDMTHLLKQQEAKIQELEFEKKQLLGQKNNLEHSLNQIISSRSWRLTASLRKVGRAVKLTFPLLRWRSTQFTLTPGRNVIERDGKLAVTGPSPTIDLVCKSAKPPRGWVKLVTDLDSEKLPLFFLLYYGLKGDYNPVNRSWLTFQSRVSEPPVFRIPEWTTELRLDPFDAETAFAFRKFEICEIGKLQVFWHLLKKQIRPILWHPPILFKKIGKLFSLLREGGFGALRIRLFANDYTSNYQEWVRQYDTLTDSDRAKILSHIHKLERKPLISIVMPVYNVEERWLRAAIDSVRGQLYENWELCIADDASPAPHIKTVLGDYAARDKRVKVVYRPENGHISRASNSALELATGEFVALLDNDDELTPDALYQVAVTLNKTPNAGLVFSDEDKLTSYGMRFNPYFKSGWNPELFLVQNFICHLGVYRRSILNEIGGFRAGFEGAQDWDLALRVIEKLKPDQIVHIPHVLYHWRVIEGSTAQSTSYKPYVLEAQRKAVAEHLERTGVNGAEVEILQTISHLRVKFPLPRENPLVSIIIPTRDLQRVLEKCVESILAKTTYKNYEIIIVDNGSEKKETLDYLAKLESAGKARIIRDDRPFNYSRLNNDAARVSRGELLAFLNNDLEIINPEWLTEMVSHAVRPGVGAVGARLLYPSDLVQHAGVVLGIGGVAGHSHKGRPKHDPGYFNTCVLTHCMGGVTAACMVVSKKTFEEVGCFNEEQLAVAFNDVDLCIKILQSGRRNIYCAEAELYHYESISRGYENTPQKFNRFEREIEYMKRNWRAVLQNDPYYNPNLTLLTEDFTFAFPPRCEKPWSSA